MINMGSVDEFMKFVIFLCAIIGMLTNILATIASWPERYDGWTVTFVASLLIFFIVFNAVLILIK